MSRAMGGLPVKRTLPYKRICQSLYAIVLKERTLLRSDKSLCTFLADPQVEGVYESKVSPTSFIATLIVHLISELIHSGATGIQLYIFTWLYYEAF